MKKKPNRRKAKYEVCVVINLSRQVGNSIPKDANPTKLHVNEATAITEAKRLAAHQPSQSFAVFKAVGVAVSQPLRIAWTARVPVVVAPLETPF